MQSIVTDTANSNNVERDAQRKMKREAKVNGDV